MAAYQQTLNSKSLSTISTVSKTIYVVCVWYIYVFLMSKNYENNCYLISTKQLTLPHNSTPIELSLYLKCKMELKNTVKMHNAIEKYCACIKRA